MSLDRVPSRSEVMGWSPQQLADYLKRFDIQHLPLPANKMNLSGCDKTVLKNSINGSRFVNLSDNDLQKFPKLQAPFISKISTEISKKEEKRCLFGKKSTPKYYEPDTSADVQGWGEDEFDNEDFDDDYESPFSGDEDGSVGDYESPNEEVDGNDYEPPPSEPPEDLPHTLCPPLPPGDENYIDNRVRPRGLPPVLSPRPQVASLSPPVPAESTSRRDPSPHCGGRPSAKYPPEPPQICRDSKPRRDQGSNLSPIRGPHRNTVDRPCSQALKPPPVPPSSTSISRSSSSTRPSPNRFNVGREQTQSEAPNYNTFPLQAKGLPPRPGLPGPPSRHADSVPPVTASLPHKLKSALAEHRSSFSGADTRQFPTTPPASLLQTQDLDPVWYVGKVTRGQAEGCLRRVQKDGVYLVRDSTRQLENQPFTLMVFYQNKVYNIQIRQQNQQFLLGTGLKAQECFPSVGEIIAHYSSSPLLLIDAKNRSSNQQNQCVLSEPAGYHMTGPDRS